MATHLSFSLIDSDEWPFFSGGPGDWFAEDVDDVARFLRVQPDRITHHRSRPVPRSALRGQRVSVELGEDWWVTISALTEHLSSAQNWPLTIQTPGRHRTSVIVTAEKTDRSIDVAVQCQASLRWQEHGSADMVHTESDVAWTLLGWSGPRSSLTLASRTFPLATPSAYVAYAIIEVLSLIELTSGSQALLVQRSSGWGPLVTPEAESVESSTDHFVHVTQAEIDEMDVANARFHNVILSSLDLADRNLSRADFTGSVITDTSFDGSVLDGAIFRRATMRQVRLDRARSSSLDLVQAHLKGCRGVGARFEQLNVFGASIDDCDFHDLESDRLLGSHANIRSSRFDGAILRSAELTNATISDANFARAELVRAHFDGSILEDVSFAEADLTGARFHRYDRTLLAEALEAREGLDLD